MEIPITKSARQFGYLIWNKRYYSELDNRLKGYEKIKVNFNGFDLGEKSIDRKFHRISLGYKFTRAVDTNHNMFSVEVKDGVLEVRTFNGQ